MDNFITGSPTTSPTSATDPRSRSSSTTSPSTSTWTGPLDYVLHFASPASPLDYLELPDPDAQGRRARHAQRARPGQGQGRALPARLHLRGLRRPLCTRSARTTGATSTRSGPRGVYDEAKRFAEAITMAYHRSHGVETRIVRIFNTYGPRMRLNDGRVIPAFMTPGADGRARSPSSATAARRAASTTSPIWSTGSWRLLERGGNDPVNIGNPQRDDPARAGQAHHPSWPARAARSSSARCPRTTPRCASPTSRGPGRLLGWEPRVDTDEGLKLTIEWFRAELAVSPAAERRWSHDRRGAAAHPGLPGLQGDLIFEETRIICPACRKAYPIRDGIPVMLINEAEPWSPERRAAQAVILAGGQGTRLRPLTLAARQARRPAPQRPVPGLPARPAAPARGHRRHPGLLLPGRRRAAGHG